jgi:hypothetical protein
MSESTALRLADELEAWTLGKPTHHRDAAAELRRLHAVNAELLKTLKLMRSRFLDVNGDHGAWEQEATDAADAAIAKAEGQA